VLLGPFGLVELEVIAIAVLLGATIYEAVVMAPNYEHAIPESIELARRFLTRRTPAHFFRVTSPLAQVLALGCALASWRTPMARWMLLGTLGILLLTDVVTFTYHYPRLRIMFKDPMPRDPERLRRAAREWTIGNYGRLALLVLAALAALRAAAALAG
jgi:hypothetical protein